MTVDEYIDSLPEDRRIAIRSVREVVNSRIPPGYEEGIVYGMIAWFVPFTRLAETYNGQPLCVASLGSQKSHMALYLMSVYGDPELRAWFEQAFKAAGKKLDMGKSCVRFKTLDALALDVIGEAISRVSVDRYVAQYEATRAMTAQGKAAELRGKPAAKGAAPAAKALPAPAKAAIATKPAGKVPAPKAAASAPAKAKAVTAKPKAAAKPKAKAAAKKPGTPKAATKKPGKQSRRR
jgi:hypothetical protein